MWMKMSMWTSLWFLLAFVSKGNARECLKPDPVGKVVLTESAILKNNFPDESEVTLKCAVGYEVDQGSDTITCMNGEWSKQELTCKKRDCGPPNPSPNMHYDIPNGTLFAEFIRPYCEPGYRLQGSSYRQCLASGWTRMPKCLLITCGKLPEIPHSIRVSNLTKVIVEYKDRIEYSCEDKYTLVGNRFVVCQENGRYSSLPQCKVECLRPVPVGKVVLTESAILKNNFPDESEVTLKCAVGYEVDQGSDTITCINGEWSKQELTCKKLTCGKLPEISHSIIVSNLTKKILEFEERIEYRCDNKTTLVGNRFVVCQENGQYSSLPQCKGECLRPVPVGNVVLTDSAILKNNFPDESEVTLKCAVGYEVDQGSDTITCMNGEWSKQELTCKMITCGKLPEIPHSIRASNLTKVNVEFKDRVEYSCEDKHTLVGNGFVVCQENGQYSSLPQCKEKESLRSHFSPYSGIIIVIIVFIVSGFVYIIVMWRKKQNGSYDTGEDKRPQEALIQENRFSYINKQCKGP